MPLHLIYLVEWVLFKLKTFKMLLEKIGSGFEVKENMKIKDFKKGKIYFWRTYQNFSILFE